MEFFFLFREKIQSLKLNDTLIDILIDEWMNHNTVGTSRTDLKMFPESNPVCTSCDYQKIIFYIFPIAVIVHVLCLVQLCSV